MKTHDAECGCSINSTYDYGELSYIIVFCPLHQATPDLLTAAEAVAKDAFANGGNVMLGLVFDLKTAVAKARG